MKREAVIETLRKALPDLKARYPINRIDLFGSVARGDETKKSDVDLLVDVDPEIGLGLVDLSDELERLLKGPVDVATTRGINPRLKKRIEGELVHVE